MISILSKRNWRILQRMIAVLYRNCCWRSRRLQIWYGEWYSLCDMSINTDLIYIAAVTWWSCYYKNTVLNSNIAKSIGHHKRRAPARMAIYSSPCYNDTIIMLLSEWQWHSHITLLCTLHKKETHVVIKNEIKWVLWLRWNASSHRLFDIMQKNIWNERTFTGAAVRWHWTSYQIRKTVDCACAWTVGNGFPTTDIKGNR